LFKKKLKIFLNSTLLLSWPPLYVSAGSEHPAWLSVNILQRASVCVVLVVDGFFGFHCNCIFSTQSGVGGVWVSRGRNWAGWVLAHTSIWHLASVLPFMLFHIDFPTCLVSLPLVFRLCPTCLCIEFQMNRLATLPSLSPLICHRCCRFCYAVLFSISTSSSSLELLPLIVVCFALHLINFYEHFTFLDDDSTRMGYLRCEILSSVNAQLNW